MEIKWEEQDVLIKKEFEDRKKHFLQNGNFKKRSNSDDESFFLALLASYKALWMRE